MSEFRTASKESSRIKMATYKLVYFNARGGAEPIRFIFAQAGVTYEDKRVEGEWAKLKPTTPTGQLHLLEVEGKSSRPIARFLAERFGLAGDSDLENAELGDVLFDLIPKLFPWFYEKDEEKKKHSYWAILEKRIQDNNSDSGWIYGNKPTYADFSIYCILDTVAKFNPEFFTKYPGVGKLKAAV